MTANINKLRVLSKGELSWGEALALGRRLSHCHGWELRRHTQGEELVHWKGASQPDRF